MGQKSNVDRLPPALRRRLQELLQNPAVTQTEIVEAVNAAAGRRAISRSGLNRCKLKLDRFAAKSREAREIADAYLEKYGAENRNRLGKVANEYIRLMVFDLITELEEARDSGGDVKPELVSSIIHQVSRAIRELEQAEKLNADRTADIRAEAMKEAAEKVDEAIRQRGVTEATRKAVLAEALGITE